MFENKMIGDYLATKYVVSWVKAGGDLSMESYDAFAEWLESLELNDDEVTHIMNIAYLGSNILRTSAKRFLKDKAKEVI